MTLMNATVSERPTLPWRGPIGNFRLTPVRETDEKRAQGRVGRSDTFIGSAQIANVLIRPFHWGLELGVSLELAPKAFGVGI